MNIFRCSKCCFYPLDFEKNNYFINYNTFKCIVCSCQTILKNDQHIFVKNSTLFMNKQSIKKSVKNINKPQQHVQIHNNPNITKQHVIIVQFFPQLSNTLYIEPINSQLNCCWYLDIQSLLKQGSHVLMRLYYKFLLEQHIFNKQTLKDKRKISKLEFLLYCVDSYINVQIIGKKEGKNNQNRLNLVVAKEKIQNVKNNMRGLVDSQFQVKTYTNYQYYLKNKNNLKQNVTKTKQLKIFEKNIIKLIKFIHLNHQNQQIDENKTFDIKQQNQIIFFCNKINKLTLQEYSNKSSTIFYYEKQKNIITQKLNDKCFTLIPHGNNGQNFQQFLLQRNCKIDKDKEQVIKKQQVHIFYKQLKPLDMNNTNKQNSFTYKSTKIQSLQFYTLCKSNLKSQTNLHKIIQNQIIKSIFIPLKNIKIDRIICINQSSSSQSQIFTCVFNYNNLIKDNFQQLQCVQTDNLEIQLNKIYEEYLQEKQEKKDKAFKKKQNVFEIHQQKQQKYYCKYLCQNDDDQNQREFL